MPMDLMRYLQQVVKVTEHDLPSNKFRTGLPLSWTGAVYIMSMLADLYILSLALLSAAAKELEYDADLDDVYYESVGSAVSA